MSDRRGKPERGSLPPAFKRYRAPREDGGVLFDPAWQDLPALVVANQLQLADCSYDFLGENLAELRGRARQELISLVAGDPNDANGPLILTGHQPELFHPGVWLKNFAAGSLASRVGGLGVNLVIDSDLCRSPTIRVPTGTVDCPRVESIAYDTVGPATPYEQRAISDQDCFASFPQRVRDTIGELTPNPLLTMLWPMAIEVARQGGTLAQATSAARHQLEVAWGNPTQETPISRVCDTSSFSRFALDILARLPEFHLAHNQALADYRAAHHLRSPAQPMPDLHERDGWLEAPLWVWATDNPTRRPLYARRTGNSLELTDFDLGAWQVDLGGNFEQQIAALRVEQGIKIRSRALVTTLFARLLLADVFLHGIGGAKYDEAADRLALRFYGFTPPPHATLTATLRLPIEHDPFDFLESERLIGQLRGLDFHPEKFLADNPAAEAARANKQRWVATKKTIANAAERHRAIAKANLAMQPLIEPLRQQLLGRQKQLVHAQRAAEVLESREYAYCLFPADWLKERLMGLTHAR